MKKIAIIGASIGQLPLCLKAKEMGLFTICFAWEKGAVCQDVVDKFYPISLADKDQIVLVCKTEDVCGVVTNASDYTAKICSYVAERLGLPTTPYDTILKIQDKLYVREHTNKLPDLSSVGCCRYKENEFPVHYPCVVKPISGASKQGVSFVANADEFIGAIEYAKRSGTENVLIEDYIKGREISVECLSFNSCHYIIQITDKESSGAPHFVELAHHQPAVLSSVVKKNIQKIIPQILNEVGFSFGATHIEMKIDNQDNIFLIEINPRGAGGHISSDLVRLSTGYDYLRGMIDIALGCFHEPNIKMHLCSGIYFLCAQTKFLKPYFETQENDSWLIEKKYVSQEDIPIAVDNYSRSGYLIYQNQTKVIL